MSDFMNGVMCSVTAGFVLVIVATIAYYAGCIATNSDWMQRLSDKKIGYVTNENKFVFNDDQLLGASDEGLS